MSEEVLSPVIENKEQKESEVTAPSDESQEPFPKRRKLNPEEKKALKAEQRKAYWAYQRQREKEKRKARRKAKSAEAKAEAENGVTVSKKRRKLEDITFSDQRLVIDCGFDDLMTDKEIRKLGNQIVQLYGVNIKREKPLRLYLTSFVGKLADHMRSFDGFSFWRGVEITEKPYNEIFHTSEIVYLTAESDNVVETLKTEEVYIIGGLVDHNRIKGHVHGKVTQLGMKTARLPIDEYIKMKSRKVLTVNQVAEIMIAVSCNGGNWTAAFEELIPKRKGAVPKTSSQVSEEVGDDDNEAVQGAPSSSGNPEGEATPAPGC